MTAPAREGAPPGTEKLLADLCLERLSGLDACRWALSALEAGFDTPSLRILAGMALDHRTRFFEVRPSLEAALGELDLPASPNRDEVLREYARVLAEELLAGVRPVEATLEIIHGSVVSPLCHPEDLRGWCYLWEGLAPEGATCGLTGPDLERATRDFAARWLSGRRHSLSG